MRDELLEEGRRVLRKGGLQATLDDRRIIDLDDMYYDGQIMVHDRLENFSA